MSLILIGCEPRSLRRCAVELRGVRGGADFQRRDRTPARTGERDWLDQEERAGCMRVREKWADVSPESEGRWTRGRAVIHALSRGCTMRASRVMRFVRHWFSVGASFDRPPHRINTQYRYFVSLSKG